MKLLKSLALIPCFTIFNTHNIFAKSLVNHDSHAHSITKLATKITRQTKEQFKAVVITDIGELGMVAQLNTRDGKAYFKNKGYIYDDVHSTKDRDVYVSKYKGKWYSMSLSKTDEIASYTTFSAVENNALLTSVLKRNLKKIDSKTYAAERNLFVVSFETTNIPQSASPVYVVTIVFK